ncbi:MAG: YSC84-related protein [Kiloniellales bacterium]|nr:YSC84-related protein [Kiloniellales bacterium]
MQEAEGPIPGVRGFRLSRGERQMHFAQKIVLAAAIFVLAACSSNSSSDKSAKRTEINNAADAAWSELVAENPAARDLAKDAKGVAIFPDIIKGGLIVGGETGDGVLRVGGDNAAYYNVSSASIGLQIGGQSYSQVLMFLTDEALASFRASSGWEAGVDGTVAVIDKGASGDLDTSNIAAPVVAFIFGEEGLMGGVSLEGSKYTRLDL